MGLVTARRAAAGLVLIAGLGLGLVACGDDRDEDSGEAAPATSTAPATGAPPATTVPETAPAPPQRPEALPGLPAFTAGFQRWDRLNARPIPPDSPQTQRVGFDAHRSTKDVYVSVPRARLRRGGEFPVGTILVKAGRTGGEITLVATMHKIMGADPAHGDWRFVEYKRSGAGSAFTTSASLTGETCWSCHQIAEDTDWVFTQLAAR
jgi:Cytochrome P460